ncbi:MAG: pyridoxal phosphate-dependent aminotransferase [Desulfobacterales bacterium]|nr:pyridoxal phosphate-dependent aminotransferase [Desulfobacteraceae bacterium]MBT4365736.1 pyridoxal phosphate-dependent aminotransferase [Desulfobacteraceae bacterium]MBT7086426.1 pyridoxal phosphate-dependent aminotransferase [Desulfobacterales bacterium]MBT7698411.1 pyridoxal phosphate-dependent aminotransferase [Desulfobacterales bacterium]
MTVSKYINTTITKSSWIRKMFEEGALLKAKYGVDNVFDFSLGNPNLKPPDKFKEALKEAACDISSGTHAYMPNNGYPHVRKSIAEYLSQEQQTELTENEIVITSGAAGALNVIFKTILNPGDEIICPAPYFVEYNFYAENHNGVLKTVSTNPDFTLNIEAIASAITDKTKAVLINSPNNPTGQVYSKESLDALGNLLKKKRGDQTIYLISDEPYRKIVYDGLTVPSIFTSYNESIIATSYSKDISIPGERIGFIGVNPNTESRDDLLAGMALANRILGFVNAPALMQRVLPSIQGMSVDISVYSRKRELLCNGLAECGYEFVTPPGAFYLFPKSPIEDDVKFVQALQEELILAVPGSGFGGPGHFRIAFCVDDNTITGALPGFKKVIDKF